MSGGRTTLSRREREGTEETPIVAGLFYASFRRGGKLRSVAGWLVSIGRWVCVGSLLLTFIVGFFWAQSIGLIGSDPSNRTRFHAIPVAISQIYQGRTHNYTGYYSVAAPFQSAEPISELIKSATEQTVEPGAALYFWPADDRGMSDYVNMAFRLFGPRVVSLGYFWFVLLGLSTLLAVLRFWRDATALAIVASAEVAVVATIPAYLRAIGFSFQEISINISESRLFDVLGAIAMVHLILAMTRPPPIPRWIEPLTLGLQSLFLAFLFLARSSLALAFLALILLGLGFTFARRSIRDGQVNSGAALRVAGFVAFAWLGTLVYQQATFHSAYKGELSGRTIWHNVMIGMAISPTFAKHLQLHGIDDGEAIEAVLRESRKRGDPRVKDDWTRQSILNSLGSHGSFDWRTYEKVARDVALRELFEHPLATLRMFAWLKPRAAVRTIFCQAMLASVCNSGSVTLPDVQYRPIGVVPVLLLLPIILGLCIRGGQSVDLRAIAVFAVISAALAVVGLVPSVIFYSGVTQLGLTMVFGALSVYLAIAIGFFRISRTFPTKSPGGSPTLTGD